MGNFNIVSKIKKNSWFFLFVVVLILCFPLLGSTDSGTAKTEIPSPRTYPYSSSFDGDVVLIPRYQGDQDFIAGDVFRFGGSTTIIPTKKGLGSVVLRPFFAATPSLNLIVPDTVIGEPFTFTAQFSNTGDQPGYGPFIDLVLPRNKQADGDGGVTYYGAEFLTIPLEDYTATFPGAIGDTGCVSHPWLRDDTGAYVDVCGPSGDLFVSLRLPFGSFVPGQPQLNITVNAELDDTTYLTPDLLIYGRSGFMFGETPTDDWCCGDVGFANPPSTDSTSWPSAPITPTVFTFSKEYNGPGDTQDETATGPNFLQTYTLTVELAEDQTLTGVEVYDQLPDNLQFTRIVSTTIPPTSTVLPSTTEPGGTLQVNFAGVSSPADTPLEIVVEFYIPEFYDGPDVDLDLDDPVIDPDSGDDVNSENIAWAVGTWDPADPDDPITPISSDDSCPLSCPPLHTLQDKSIAIQKTVEVIDGINGNPLNDDVGPGAILEYTLSIQVSDYFSFDDLVVTDVISDGQHLLEASDFTPRLAVNDNGYAEPEADFDPANYAVSCDYTGATTTPPTECTIVTGGTSGTTTLTFNLTDELITRSRAGTLVGGCVNTGVGIIDPCDPANIGDGPTEATIVFRTEVLEEFTNDFPSTDRSVDQGDELTDDAQISGDILDNITGAVEQPEADDARELVVIERLGFSKSIYAINDEPDDTEWLYSGGEVRVMPGDKVTYRITYDLLTSDVEELTFNDYFPLPVFHVDDPDEDDSAGPAWSFTDSGGIPDPGVVTLGPLDTFYDYMTTGLSGGTGVLEASPNNDPPTQEPVVASDTAQNKISIYYADYDDTRNQSTTVDLLFSLVVSDDPFADGLFLTNMAQAYEGSTNADDSEEFSIIRFVLNEPVLVSSKGVVWTSNSGSEVTFTPTQVGPVGVTFLDPADGSVPPRWTGTIDSDGLDANPINSNLSGVDAGDTVTFAITIENQGNSIKGAFDIQLRDVIDTDFFLEPADGTDLNLQVYYGNGSGDPDNPGNPIPYQSVDTDPLEICTGLINGDDCGLELFEEGIELIDPVDPDQGICQTYDPNNGNNVIVITYDLVIKPDVNPGQALNTVYLMNFAGSEDGPNHLDEDQEDQATVDVVGDLEKTLDGTEFGTDTIPDDEVNEYNEVVIGELVYYTLTVTVPEGIVPNARVVDQLDGGLAFLSCDSVDITADTGVVTDLTPEDFSGVCTTTESFGITNNGQDILFDLGTITNNDRDDNLETIAITYTAVATNIGTNQEGQLLNNSASFLMNQTGSPDVILGTAAADEVLVIEPDIITTKTTPVGTGDAGNPITYTITLENESNPEDTDAYDVAFRDDFPLCPVPADGSAVHDLSIDSQSGPATFVLSEPAGVGTGNTDGWRLTATGFDLLVGETATVTLSGTIAYCVYPGFSIDNTGTTTWTSLDGDFSTARSTFNTASVERTGADGVDGALNDYASEDTASVVVDNPINTKYIIDTSEESTGFVNNRDNVAIGEIVRYRLVSTIPEGTSPNFQVRDFLPSGLMYLDDDTTYVRFVSNAGISTSGIGIIPAIDSDFVPDGCNTIGFTADASIPSLDPTTLTVGDECTLADNNISRIPDTDDDGNDNFDVGGRDVYFKLGTLVNNDSDPDIEYVVIEFNALAHNSPTNQNDAGEQPRNRHRIYINGETNGGFSDYVYIRIAEPVLDVSKSIVGTPPEDAGDPIEYQIIVNNNASGNSAATLYDIVLTDTFDANLENLAISSVTSSQGDWTDPLVVCDGDGAGATDFDVTDPITFLGQNITVNISCLDPGENVTINVTGDVLASVSANTNIENDAVVVGTSLEGPQGTTGNDTGSDTPGSSGTDRGERDGSDTDTGGPDDHYDLDDADVRIDAPLIDKTVDEPAQLPIGITYYYDILVTLPDGLTEALEIHDFIPDGVEVVNYVIITETIATEPDSILLADFDGTLPVPTVVEAGGSGGDITFTFGDVTVNEEHPNDSDNNSFQIRLEMLVLNEIGNQNGVDLTNTAELRYTGGSDVTDSVVVEIDEPVIVASKTTNPSPANNLDAGDTFQYILTLEHDDGSVAEISTADAFDVSLTDLLDLGSDDILILSVDGVVLTGGASVDSAVSITGGGTGLAGQFDIPLNGSVVITYTAELQDSVRPDQTLTNDVDLNWSSLDDNPDEARDGSGGDVDDYFTSTSDDAYTRDLLSITKQVIDSSESNTSGSNLTIGEEVTYELTVTVIEGTTDSVVVTDTLPDNLNFITGSASVTLDGPAGMTTGYSGTPSWADPVLTFDLGQVVNPGNNVPADDTITITFEALVENDFVNQEPDTKTNTAEVTDGNLSDSDTADVDLVEPNLLITKTADDDTPTLNQLVEFTVLITNTGSSTAFEVELNDTLPSGLTFDSFVSLTPIGGSCTTNELSQSSTASSFYILLDEIQPGCDAEVIYRARVDSPPSLTTPAVGSTLDNTVHISWTSIQSDNDNERSGDDVVGTVDDYDNETTETLTVTNPDLRVTKDDGVLFYIPGESVTYTITVTNQGNADVSGALVSDSKPPEVETWTWVCAGPPPAGIGCDGVVNSMSNFSDTINLTAGQSFSYTVTANTYSSATTDMTNVVIVEMPDDVIEPTPEDNTDDDTDTATPEADLAVIKDDGVTLISAGETLTYTIVVENLSPSDVPGATVTDPKPPQIDSWAWACTGATGGATGCTPAASSSNDFSDTVDLPAYSSLTYTVTAQVSDTANGSLTNEVTVAVPEGITERNLDDNTDDDVDRFPEGNKLLTDQLHGVTPALDEVEIGEIITYQVVLSVPEGTMPNLILLDTLDRGLAFVDCLSITGPGLSTIGPADLDEVCSNPTVSTYPIFSPDPEDEGRQVRFEFGELVNNTGAEVDLEVNYRVVVLDSLENQSDTTPLLVNEAVWTWASGTLTDRADGVQILEPDLYITKGVDGSEILPGQLKAFTIVIGHTAESQTSAFDVVLRDTIPPELDFVGPVNVSGPGTPTVDLSGLPEIVVYWPELPDTAPAVVEFDVMLDPSIEQQDVNQKIINQASVAWSSIPEDYFNPQTDNNDLSTERFYDPGSDIDIYQTADDAELRVPKLPATGFAPGRITSIPQQPDDLKYGDLAGLRLEIPAIDLSVPIVSIPLSSQGWDLTWLWNQAGWLEGTAYPSWYGNTVLTAHAYLANGLPGPFVRLDQLSWGDEIYLYAHGLKYTYQIRNRELITAGDLSILKHKDQDWMTLFTCKGFDERLDEYRWRQVVQAVLIDVEEIP